MAEKKNTNMDNPVNDSLQKSDAIVAEVNVETVMKGAQLVKDKYELLYEDIIEK
mgnify:CR=1 FL=1